ncbi:hypothetical protein KH172YL63_10490 [Bacillus sp. KH172YL63]|nr:hypothetical protein KH172YL63_10490 [Bacillus sp. KH172YL63]
MYILSLNPLYHVMALTGKVGVPPKGAEEILFGTFFSCLDLSLKSYNTEWSEFLNNVEEYLQKRRISTIGIN